MRSRTPSDVYEAFHRVVHDYNGGEQDGGGVPALARLMGMPPGTLYNKANTSENDNNHNKPTLKDVVLATILSGDVRIIQSLCHTAGGVFYRLPDLSDFSTDALLLHLTRIEAESGDFYSCIDKSLRQDSDLTHKEFQAIEAEAHQWVAAILETVHRLREMAGVEQ